MNMDNLYRVKQVPSLIKVEPMEAIDYFLDGADMYVAQIKYWWNPFKWYNCYEYKRRATYERAENDILSHMDTELNG